MALPSWSWKLAETVSSTGFGCRAARLFEAAFEVATVALKATLLAGPEGYVWAQKLRLALPKWMV